MPGCYCTPLNRQHMPALTSDKQARTAKRKELRALLLQFAAPSYLRGLSLVGFDLLLFAALSVSVVVAPAVVGKLLASLGLGLVISRLFVLGHDAGHQSLTPSRQINTFVARLVFLPTYSCLSLWEAGHNIAHHGFPGLRGRDIPWVPLSPEQYLGLSRGGRWLYRAYRSWWGSGLYYGIELWWKRLYFPRGKIRPTFFWDSVLVTAAFVLQAAAYVAAAWSTGQSAWILLAFGVVVPFVLWLHLAAIVFYIHHTDVDSRWYDSEPEWRAAQSSLNGTRGTRLPLRLDLLLHHALEHTAHHVNAAIPSYRLAAAQRLLESRYPSEVQMHTITIGRYLEITRQCQLYDATRHVWLTIAEVQSAPIPDVVR